MALAVAISTLALAPGLGFAQNDQFTAGNQHYANKEYARAIKAYQQVLAQGVESAQLYYNLGNAYFKHGDLGHAIANYLKARRLDPANEEIQFNLEFARQFTHRRSSCCSSWPLSCAGGLEQADGEYAPWLLV